MEVQEGLPNQKAGLCGALLSLGMIRPVIATMSEFPWIVDAYPELSDLMIRILDYSIRDLYEQTFESSPQQKKSREAMKNFAVPKSRVGPSGPIPAPERKPHVTLIAPTPPPTSTTDFVFFFPEWTQYVPVCSSMDDVVDVVEP